MPKLSKSKNKKSTQEYGIEFLPDHIQTEIHKVFDNYFGLEIPKDFNRPVEASINFPKGVSSLDLNQVRDYHGEFEAWLGFIRNKVKFIKAAMIVVSNEREDAYNDELGKLLLEKGNIEAKKAQARSGESYKVLNKYYSKLQGLYEILEKDEQKYEAHTMSLRAELKSREINNTF